LYSRHWWWYFKHNALMMSIKLCVHFGFSVTIIVWLQYLTHVIWTWLLAYEVDIFCWLSIPMSCGHYKPAMLLSGVILYDVDIRCHYAMTWMLTRVTFLLVTCGTWEPQSWCEIVVVQRWRRASVCVHWLWLSVRRNCWRCQSLPRCDWWWPGAESSKEILHWEKDQNTRLMIRLMSSSFIGSSCDLCEN